MTAPRRALAPLAGLALAAELAAQPAAQRPERTVRGEVRTPDSLRVVGATVWVFGTRAPTDSTIAGTTDQQGGFRFTLPVSATSELVVRRRGLADGRAPLRGEGEGTARRPVVVAPIVVRPAAEPLVSVVVRDSGRYEGRDAQFFRNVAARRGEFMTRAQLSRLNPTSTGQALRQLRGVTLGRSSSTGGTFVRLSGRPCLAAVFLDGASMGTRTFDVDLVSPQSLTGVEVYAQPGGLPPEYQTMEAQACGVVALWTRRLGEDAEALEAANPADPASVRTVREVDTPARLADGERFAPIYAPESRATGVGGRILIEAVVDTAGAVERNSIGAVAVSAAELAPSVLRAAGRLRFTPALQGGRPVRQLVHLLAEFQPATSPLVR